MFGDIMKEIKEIENYAHENHVPILLKDGLEFILDLIKDRHVKNILEVGTAIGYSSICMAKLDPEIQIDTLELDEQRYKEALFNISENGLENQIHAYLTDAMEFSSDNKYDLIFIDAAKSQYRRYMEHFYPNLNLNGIYVFDNLNFHGFVDDPTLTNNRSTRQMCAKIKRFRDWILAEESFDTQFYSQIGDGLAVVSVKQTWDMLK